MKKIKTTKIISLVLVVAIVATVLSLGVYFAVAKPSPDSSFSSSPEGIMEEATSEVSKGSPTASTGPTSIDNVETGYSSDAGNVLVKLTSTTAPSGATAISNQSQLNSFVGSGSTYGYLTADISIDGSSTYKGVTSNSLTSSQTLDGNGHTITITGNNNQDTGYAMLSGMTNDAVAGLTNNSVVQGLLMPKNNGTIKNLKIVFKKNYNLHTNSNSLNMVAGLFVGWNAGTIENCSATFAVNSRLYTHCSGRSTDTTTNGAYVGGIAGVNTGTIEYCTTSNYARNWEAAAYYQVVMGGIAGVNNGGRIAYCVYRGSGEMYANGDTGTGGGAGSAIGGIVGISGQDGNVHTVDSGQTGGPKVDAASGTLTMCHSSYTGTFKVGGGSKYIGLVAGNFDTQNATLVGLTAYSADSAFKQVGGSDGNKAAGTYTIADIDWLSGQGYTRTDTFDGGRLYFANTCDYNVYYDYWTQSDRMYVEFDNPAAISSVTPSTYSSVKSMTYDTTSKTLSVSATEFSNHNRFYSGEYYIGASDITYQGYEATYAYGSTAATDSQGSGISTSDTLITQNTMLPLTGETDYYLLDDVYIDLSTQYSGSRTGNFRGLVNGNGHNIYFYTSTPVSASPSVTETYYFGILSNEIGGDNNNPGECGFKNMGVVFMPNCNFSAVTTGGNSKAGIITGLQKLQYSSKIDNVKIDIQDGATVTIGNNNNNQNSYVGVVVGQLTATTDSRVGRTTRIWINLEGSFIIAKGTDRAAYAGALWGWGLNSNININGGIGGYYILSGDGTFRVNSSCNDWTTIGLFGGASDGGYSINSGSDYAIGLIFWDWAWRVNQSNGGHVNMQAGRQDPDNGGFHERKWVDSITAYFINADPSYGATNAFTKAANTYTVKWVNGGTDGTTQSLDDVYGTYSIYQALGTESRILTDGIAGSQTKYNAEKYVDTNIATTGLTNGYGNVSTIARYQSVGYVLQDTTLKLKVDIVNKNTTPMGYQYDGNVKGRTITDYLLVPAGYSTAPDGKKAKVAAIAGLGVPYSITDGGTNVGTHSVNFTLSSTQSVSLTANASHASVVIYPATKPDIAANTVSRNYVVNSNTHTYSYLGSTRTVYYSQKSNTNVYAYYDGSDTLGDNVPIWLSINDVTTYTVPEYYNGSTVVASSNHYVLTNNGNYTFGTVGGTAVVSGSYILLDVDGGQIILQDITNNAFSMTVVDNNGTSYPVLHNGVVTFPYDGTEHRIASASMKLGNTNIPLTAVSTNSLTNVTDNGVTLSFTSTLATYTGTFIFKYYVTPRTLGITGVQAVYNSGTTFDLDTTKSSLINNGGADTSNYAIATITGIVNNDALGSLAVTFDNAVAGVSKSVTIATTTRNINGTSYNMLGAEGTTTGNYCVTSNSLGAVGTIVRRKMTGLTTNSDIFYKSYVQNNGIGESLSFVDGANAVKPNNSSNAYVSVYNKDVSNYNASDYLYTDSAMTAPVKRVTLEKKSGGTYTTATVAKEVGEYRVKIDNNDDDPNYDFGSTSGNSTELYIYFNIVKYNVLITATTDSTYGDEGVDTTATIYTYKAYGSILSDVTWASSPSVDFSSYDKTWDAGSVQTQTINANFDDNDGNYHVPSNTGGHILNINKALIYVKANDNITSKGDVDSGKATQDFSFVTPFRNGDTASVVTTTSPLKYIYVGIDNTSTEGYKANVIFIAKASDHTQKAETVEELEATNYYFVQDTSVGGNLTIKLAVESVVDEDVALPYTGGDYLSVLVEGKHYTLSQHNITADISLRVVGKYNDANVLDKTVTDFVSAGKYVIEFVIEEGSSDAEIYTITPMEWTIHKAAAYVKANAYTAEYGDVPTGNNGYTISLSENSQVNLPGVDNGKESTLFGDAGISYVYSYIAGSGITGSIAENGTVNAYTITPHNIPEHENYTFTAQSGVLTISPRTIIADWYIDEDYHTLYDGNQKQFVYEKGTTYTIYPKIANAYNNQNISIIATGGNSADVAGTYYATFAIDNIDTDLINNYILDSSAKYEWVVNRKPVEVTSSDITINDIFYQGTSKSFTVGDFVLAADKADIVTVMNILDEDGNIAKYLDATTYAVKIVVMADSNHIFATGEEAIVDFTAVVLKATIDISTIAFIDANAQTYNGNAITYSGADFIEPTGASIINVEGNHINAGRPQYTLTLSADQNHCFNNTQSDVDEVVNVSALILRASVNSTLYNKDNIGQSIFKPYTGQEIAFEAGDFSKPVDDYATITAVRKVDGMEYINVSGDKTVTVTLSATENYCFDNNQSKLTIDVSDVVIIILRANIDNITIEKPSKTYTGKTVVFEEDDFIAPQYTTIILAESIEDQAYINANDYQYNVTLKADDNHCFVDQDQLTKVVVATVNIAKAELIYMSNDINQRIIEYSNTEIDFKALHEADASNPLFTAPFVTINVPTSVKGINVGTYNVVLKLVADSNHFLSPGHDTITYAAKISVVQVYIERLEGVVLEKVYDGLDTYTKDIVLDTHYTVVTSDNNTAVIGGYTATFDIQNVGDNRVVTVIFTLSDEDNYEFANGNNSITFENAKITPYNIAINDISAVTREYDGTKNVSLSRPSETVAGVNGEQLTVRLVGATIPSADKGVYNNITPNIWLEGKDGSNSDNYTFTASNLDVEILAMTIDSVTWNVTESTKFVYMDVNNVEVKATFIDALGAESTDVKIVYNNDESVEFKNAGIYTVNAKSTNDNYNITASSINLTMQRRPINYTEANIDKTPEYVYTGSEVVLSTDGFTQLQYVTYTIRKKDGLDYVNVSDNIAVDLELTTDSNHVFTDTGSDSKVLSSKISIIKANPLMVVSPSASAIVYNDTLEKSVLTDGQAGLNDVITSVSGSFSWLDKNTVAYDVGSLTFDVLFTPSGDDANNFNTAIFSVVVVVGKATPNIEINPTSTPIYFGQSLASSRLEDGKASVLGNFVWVNDTIEPASSKVFYYQVKFIPTDTTHYNDVELADLIAVTVLPPEAKITIVMKSNGVVVDGLTYGELLSSLVLSDSIAKNNNGDDLGGSFSWKSHEDIYPSVADSATTFYDILWTPDEADKDKYSDTTVYTTIKVAPLQIVVSDTEISKTKVYDGELDAEVIDVGASNILAKDSAYIELIANAVFEDKNVGTGKKITVTYALYGNNSTKANYILPEAIESNEGIITALTAEILWQSTLSFPYDTEEKEVLATIVNGVKDDDIEISYTGNKAVGAGKHIATITGLSNANYQLPQNDDTTITQEWFIQQAAVELVWDSSTFIYMAAEHEILVVDIKGVFSGDIVNVDQYTGNKAVNAGKNYIATAVSLDNENYTITLGATYGYEIQPLKIEAIGYLVTTEKVYNGSYKADVNVESLTTNIYDSEVSLSINATYRQNTVGDRQIDVVFSVLDDQYDNYIEPDSYTLSGKITPLTAELSWTGNILTYNGYDQYLEATVTNKQWSAGIEDTVYVTFENYSNRRKDEGTQTAYAVIFNENYVLKDVDKTRSFTIEKATLTDKTTDITAVYTGQEIGLSLKLDGFKGSDNIGVATKKLFGTTQDNLAEAEIKVVNVSDSKTIFYSIEFQNYYTITGSKTITISKATVTVTPTAKSLTKQYDGTIAVVGDITSEYYTVSINSGAKATFDVTPIEYDSQYVDTASIVRVQFSLTDASNFKFGDDSSSIIVEIGGTIQKAVVTIAAINTATPITKVYDGSKDVLQAIEKDIHYTVTYSTVATNVVLDTAGTAYSSSQVSQGNNNILAVFSLDDNANFTFKLVNETVQNKIYINGKILPAEVTVAAKSSYATIEKVYDGTLNYDGDLTSYYEVSSTGAMPALHIESATFVSKHVDETNNFLTVVIGNTDINNFVFKDDVYTITFDNVKINRRTVKLTVIANPITYGSIAQYIYTIDNAIQGDTVITSANFVSGYDIDVEEKRNVGSYNVSLDTYTIDANYVLDATSITTAVLKVEKAPLTITADNLTVHYGDPTPTYTAQADGLKFEDSIASLGTIVFDCKYTSTSPVEQYIITPSGLAEVNYSITYIYGVLKVVQSVVMVKANNARIEYGEVPGNSGVVYLINGVETTIEDIVGSITYTYNYQQYGAVGTYNITPVVTGITAGNYTFEAVSGELTVEPRKLEVTAGNVSQVYGNQKVNLSLSKYYSITSGSLVNNDRLLGTMVVKEFENVEVPAKDVYTITCGTLGLGNTNYEIVKFIEGKYTIEARHIIITLMDQYIEEGQDINQTAYIVRSGTVLPGDNLGIALKVEKEEGATQGTIVIDTASINPNYSIEYRSAFVRYGKEDSQIIYNNSLATSITINIPYDGKEHKLDISCTSGSSVIITYNGYEIANSFKEVNTYDLILSAKETNTHHAPLPVNVTVRIYYENLTSDVGIGATISSSTGFEKSDKFVVTELDKSSVDLSTKIGEGQTIYEQYAITLKDGGNNNVTLTDAKLVIDVPDDQIINDGIVTILVCEKGEYRVVTATVTEMPPTSTNPEGAKKIVIDVNEGIEQIAFINNTGSAGVLDLGLGGLIAAASFGAIIALLIVFFLNNRNKKSRRR